LFFQKKFGRDFTWFLTKKTNLLKNAKKMAKNAPFSKALWIQGTKKVCA
jgi:hypothetical protein